MLLMLPFEVVQASFLSSLFLIWYVWILNFRCSEKCCQIGAFVFAGVILFPFFIKSFFLWSIWHFFQTFWNFGSFHLVYLLDAHMKLNGQKWLDEMKQRNSEKNRKFLVLKDKWFFYLFTFNSKADVMTKWYY